RCDRRPVRRRGPAQLRRRLRPHADGLEQQLRGRLAAVRRAAGRDLPAEVAVLPAVVRGGVPGEEYPALAVGVVAGGGAGWVSADKLTRLVGQASQPTWQKIPATLAAPAITLNRPASIPPRGSASRGSQCCPCPTRPSRPAGPWGCRRSPRLRNCGPPGKWSERSSRCASYDPAAA